MEATVIQLGAVALIFFSFRNIHRILSSQQQRIQVMLPKRQEAVVSAPVCNAPVIRNRVIDVQAVDVRRCAPKPKALPTPEDWTFDDLYRSSQ